ncbi:hypothetical protein [Paenibacillus spongiae]|uniref:Uncharacterized protein n=1 Tax=Paenibacillus spongiae TaxID=2909671 RepID=A0ABY5S4T0_9BACL|nr:hypothetical protein [Paenibacillus spongiae]UVI28906.1 hypothetical protein L1F29_26220 [Paenibacillus spongiae]
MSWNDNSTVAAPLVGMGDMVRGKAIIDVNKGTVRKVKDFELPEAAADLLRREVGNSVEMIRILPQPSLEKVRYMAVQTAEYGIWLIDAQNDSADWVGVGFLLGWADGQRLAVWDTGEQKGLGDQEQTAPPPYFLAP